MWGVNHLEAIFVGAAMVATSVGITAQVLRSKGLLGDQSSQIILAAAVIDDVLGLIVLAVVSGVGRGRFNVLEIVLTAAMAIAFTGAVAVWGTKTVATLVPRLERRGAFLAGMALSETIEECSRDLTHGVTELLVPFFLTGIGLHLDLHVFAQPAVLLLCLVILVAAVLSKLIGCGLAVAHLGWASMLRVGTGMVPQWWCSWRSRQR